MKKFEGKLDDLPPGKLINDSKKDDFDSFFLVLGMVFNDLKGLMLFEKLFSESYPKPTAEETSNPNPHSGEYGGIQFQINKMFISTIYEFLLFLKKNKRVTSSPKFLFFLKGMDRNTVLTWDSLVNPGVDKTSIFNKIRSIRSSITFHFDQDLEELRKGFIQAFFKESKKLIQHKKAYFSIGGSMEYTRFYYADAAVQEYINSLLTQANIEVLKKAIIDMNSSIQALMSKYLNDCKNKK